MITWDLIWDLAPLGGMIACLIIGWPFQNKEGRVVLVISHLLEVLFITCLALIGIRAARTGAISASILIILLALKYARDLLEDLWSHAVNAYLIWKRERKEQHEQTMLKRARVYLNSLSTTDQAVLAQKAQEWKKQNDWLPGYEGISLTLRYIVEVVFTKGKSV